MLRLSIIFTRCIVIKLFLIDRATLYLSMITVILKQRFLLNFTTTPKEYINDTDHDFTAIVAIKTTVRNYSPRTLR